MEISNLSWNPMLQIERAIGPILGIFIDQVLTETFHDDPEFCGNIETICPEFPLKQLDTKYYLMDSVDWLMYNKDRNHLILFELKTSKNSYSLQQNLK